MNPLLCSFNMQNKNSLLLRHNAVNLCLQEYSRLSSAICHRKGLLFVNLYIHELTSIGTEKSINVQSKPFFGVVSACRIKSVALRACYFP